MKFAITACLSLSLLWLQAQHPFDSYMRRNPQVRCDDIKYNAAGLIHQLYEEQKTDSLYQFIAYWEERCGVNQESQLLRTVLDMQQGTFASEDVPSTSWIYDLLHYRGEPLPFGFAGWHDYRVYRPYYGGFPFDQGTDSIRQEIRQIAKETYVVDRDEQLYIDFIAADSPTFENIRNAPFDSRLKEAYNQVHEETRRSAETHVAFATGVVQYYGNTSLFGLRPNFGLMLGGKSLRHNYDFILSFRAGPSRDDYSFQFQDSLITHRKWTGMYVGSEYTYDFINTSRFMLGLSGGIAYDRITALTTENDIDADESKMLGSFNCNGGLVMKVRAKEDGLYFGLHLRYNWVDYRNPGGTPLDGEYLNLRFTVGSISNPTRTRRLKYLK